MKRIFVPQLDAKDTAPVFAKYAYKLPSNVEKRSVARWYLGVYYGYGNKECWIPLNSMGGIATKAFQGHTVRFPKRLDTALRKLLEKKRVKELAA